MRIHRYLTLGALLSAAAVLATGAGLTPAYAQGDEADVIEEIVVRAPIERHSVEPAGPGRPKTEVIELSRQVSFADLDLTRHKDVKQLRGRIQETAEQACERLNQMFPVTRESLQGTARCVKRAVADAEKQLEAAIEAAR